MIKLGKKKPEAAPPVQGVSVDSLIWRMPGITEAEILGRFASIGNDYAGRPVISTTDAAQLFSEWEEHVRQGDQGRIGYEAYRDDRNRRREEAAQAAAAAAGRAHPGGRGFGGQQNQAYMRAMFDAARHAREEFDAADGGELDITTWRAAQ